MENRNELLDTSNSMVKLKMSIDRTIAQFVKSDVFKQTAHFFDNLPEDVQKTELYQYISLLRTEEITYTEIVKLQKILGHETYKKSVSVLKDKKNQSKLDAYIVHIIMSNNISYREKIVVLLAHFEEFVYQATIYDRQKKDKIKCVVLQKTSDLHKMESKSYKKLALAGIVFVVYSNTDNYKKIDKRIPFRNNILHRGVISYSDKEIKKSYELLVYFLSKIIFCTSDSGVENED